MLKCCINISFNRKDRNRSIQKRIKRVVTQDHPEAEKLLGKEKGLGAQKKKKGGYNVYHFIVQEKEFWLVHMHYSVLMIVCD